MDKTDSLPISEKELKHETDIEEEIIKDGTGYGDLMSTNIMEENVTRNTETYVGAPAPQNNEVYIQEHRKHFRMNQPDLNKLKYTKIGDEINFFDNGVHGTGIVSKMSSQYITIFKDDGRFYDVHINDTFFIKDILLNKTWNDMDMAERTLELQKAHAYSPRFLNKAWNDLPIELRKVIKSGQEKGTYGNIGGSPNLGISTQFDIDADKDYEGQSHSDINEQFKHEKNKPNSSNEGHDKKKDDGTSTSTTGAFNAVYNKEDEAEKNKALIMKREDWDKQEKEREKQHKNRDSGVPDDFEMPKYGAGKGEHPNNPHDSTTDIETEPHPRQHLDENNLERRGESGIMPKKQHDDKIIPQQRVAGVNESDDEYDVEYGIKEPSSGKNALFSRQTAISNKAGGMEIGCPNGDCNYKFLSEKRNDPKKPNFCPSCGDHMGVTNKADLTDNEYKQKSHIGIPNKNNNTFGLRYSVKNIKDKSGE